MKDMRQCELEVLAAMGQLLISQLAGHDDLAHAIFDALIPQFKDRYPYHKILTEMALGQVKEKEEKKEETKGEIIAKLKGRDRLPVRPVPMDLSGEAGRRVVMATAKGVMATHADVLKALAKR